MAPGTYQLLAALVRRAPAQDPRPPDILALDIAAVTLPLEPLPTGTE